jgi:hypothetical protein
MAEQAQHLEPKEALDLTGNQGDMIQMSEAIVGRNIRRHTKIKIIMCVMNSAHYAKKFMNYEGLLMSCEFNEYLLYIHSLRFPQLMNIYCIFITFNNNEMELTRVSILPMSYIRLYMLLGDTDDISALFLSNSTTNVSFLVDI